MSESANIETRPETVADVHALLQGLLEPTRQESGCLRYTLLHHSNDPTDFTFVEEWADAAALEAHLAAPPVQAALAQNPTAAGGGARHPPLRGDRVKQHGR